MNKDFLLYLIRLGIDHPSFIPVGDIDWSIIKKMAEQQGVSAIVVDGIEHLPDEKKPPKNLLLQWIGSTLQLYEYRFERYCRTISEIASFFNNHGFRMMILKGYACALNWPKPEHRPCGDIDIWLFGKQKEADALLTKEKGILIDNSHHHHTVYDWEGFTVENHYDFINIHHHLSHRHLELLFKELGNDDSFYTEIQGEKIYLPSPNLHALFLLRHALNHFASIGINIRQVLDWAFFVEKNTKIIEWEWFLYVLDEYHMKDFFNCINAICVEDLGFSPSIFPTVQFQPCMKERVLDSIIAPEYTALLPKKLFKRLRYKYSRWKGNTWKRQMCYNESMWSAFWSGVKSHLMKPSSI